MLRWLALPALALLVGCQAPSSPPSASIASYRDAYLAQKPLPQVAAVPPRREETAVEQQQPAPVDESAAPEPPSKKEAAKRAASSTDTSPAAAASTERAGAGNYKAPVAAYIKRYAVNADSLKQAKIGSPFAGAVHGQKGSVVCVELNGASSGRTAYLLRDGTVIDSEYGAGACRDQHLAPWNDPAT